MHSDGFHGVDFHYVNPFTRCAVLYDGEAIEITRLMDHRGEETDDPKEAIACVAGPDSDGQWYSIGLQGRMPIIH